MNNKNFDVYFDYGSSKIRAAAFNKDKSINNFYYEGNYFSDYTKAKSEIEKIILNLEKNTNEYLDSINLMVDSSEAMSVSLSLAKKFDGLKLEKEDVQFLIQDIKQQVLKNYQNHKIIHIIVKNYKIDNKDYVFLPPNIKCNLLSLDITFICIPKKIIENIKKLFFNLDISINQIFCSSYAKSTSYKDNFSTTENISFVDMGFNKTSIISYNKNELSFFYVLPIGGNHITKDLSKVLNIDLIIAEKIKLYFDKDESSLIEKKLSLELVQKIIFARIEEILELCTKSIKLNQNLKQPSNFQMVLMGEGSRILDNKFKEKIVFSKEIDLLEETTQSICESALKLCEGKNKQEVVIIPKKRINKGFFEKFFHLFK